MDAYKIVLAALHDERPSTPLPRQMVKVGAFEVRCINFQVDSEKMTLHVPLNRLLAGLHVCLPTHGLSIFSPEFSGENLHNRMEELMEPALRIQVLVAQVSAGIWRRNGVSLVHQLTCYQHITCRHNMFDMDIRSLQISASLIEPNEFIVHLLNRFKLIDWFK